MNAELMPIGLREFHAVIVRSLLDVGECHGSVRLRHVDHLIKAGDSVADVRGIGQRLLPLLRERKDRVRKVALRRETTVSFVRLPSWLCICHYRTSSAPNPGLTMAPMGGSRRQQPETNPDAVAEREQIAPQARPPRRAEAFRGRLGTSRGFLFADQGSAQFVMDLL